MTVLPDENAVVGADLPDHEFEATQILIIELMNRLYHTGCLRYSDADVIMRLIDEAVAEIGYTWMDVI